MLRIVTVAIFCNVCFTHLPSEHLAKLICENKCLLLNNLSMFKSVYRPSHSTQIVLLTGVADINCSSAHSTSNIVQTLISKL